MKPLYELADWYLQLLDIMDDPDVDPGTFDIMFKRINDDIETKADNYAKIIRNMESQLEGIKAEKKRLIARQAIIEKNVARLKDDLQKAMIATGKRKFKTDLFSFGIQKNGGALPIIVDVDCSELPDELVQITEKPNLKAIELYIKQTGDVSYAHFGERGESLRIR